MYQTTSDKISFFIISLVTKYLVWIIIAVVLAIWWLFPEFIDVIGKILLFWAPAIILLLSLFIVLATNALRFKRDQKQGITLYDITISPIDFYLTDIIIYCGSLLILIVAYLFKDNGVDPLDLVFTLIFFIFASWIKKIFLDKTKR